MDREEDATVEYNDDRFGRGNSSYSPALSPLAHHQPRLGSHSAPGDVQVEPQQPIAVPYSQDRLQTNGHTSKDSSAHAPLSANSQAFGMSPARLLDPRNVQGSQNGSQQSLYPPGHSAKPQSSNVSHRPRFSPASQEQLSFQFDVPGGSPQPQTRLPASSMSVNGHGHDDAAHQAYHNGNKQMNGQAHMLSRVHNLVDRDVIPPKRRRVEHEAGSRQKAAFNGGGHNGVMGGSMAQQQDCQAKPTTRVVDLSNDNDDEVVITGTSDEREVCYGKIEGAYVNAFRVPSPKPGTRTLSEHMWPMVKIVLRRREGDSSNFINCVDATREIIGNVDVNTSMGLARLLSSNFGLRSSCRILARPRRDGDLQPGTALPSPAKYDLDLNLYGPLKWGRRIGQFLLNKHLQLVHPLFVEGGMELVNPHASLQPLQPISRSSSAAGGYSQRHQGPQRTTEEINSEVTTMFDSLEKSENFPEMIADPRITTDLLKHQRQGLYFMTHKEKPYGQEGICRSSLWSEKISPSGRITYNHVITGEATHRIPSKPLGGILADMMGLGKTLSILSLVVQTLNTDAQEWTNLPCVAEKDTRDLCGTQRKSKKSLPPPPQTPVVVNAKTTLLVSPLSTIANWEEQIKQHIKPGALKYYIYHGAGRIKDPIKLAEYDLIITTYGAVSSEFGHLIKKKIGSYPLEQVHWFRVVLDEAHMIREPTTQQAKAIFRLAANRRWAVTGTPVQNRLDDLGALICFLRVAPFDETRGFAQHFLAPFKMCDPNVVPKLRLLVASVTLRRLKDRIDLPKRHDHLVKLDFNEEENRIYRIFEKNARDKVRVMGERMSGRNYFHILQSILRLRLIAAHGKDLLDPEDLKVMCGLSAESAIELDDDDDDDSQPILSAQHAYDTYKLLKDTGGSYCVKCGGKVGADAGDVVDEEPKDETIGYLTPCLHLICNACINVYKTEMEHHSSLHSSPQCPMVGCTEMLKLQYFALKQGEIDDDEDVRIQSKDGNRKLKTINIADYQGPHTKTKALVTDLVASERESEANPEEAPIKSVVFSGWTTHLDLIQIALEQNNITFVRLDGKMSRTARGSSLNAFRDDPKIHVILVSITAGGLGLNLTTANKCYVMEPQFNPAAEAQAVDRVHRLGQKREVTTVRYIMNGSFEEKMLELQMKKQKLAQLSMDGRARVDRDEAAKNRMEEIRSLFR